MISVVTITYNNCSELKSTLDSINRIENIESVVINGGSSEDTLELLSKHHGIAVSEKDEGISDAFNKGARYSHGQAVAYLNSGDVLLDREYYLWADRVFTEDPSIGFVYSDIFFTDSIVGQTIMRPRGKLKSDLGKGMPFPHPSMIVRREIIEQIGGFSKDYKIAMDFDFVVRLLIAGHRGVYYPHTTVCMDGGGVSTSNESLGITECKKSLLQHGVFHGKTLMDFKIRSFNYQFRTAIKAIFGNQALSLLKTLKSKLK